MENNRRDFIKKSCTLCASLLTLSAVMPLMTGCTPMASIRTSVESGAVVVPKNLFHSENKIVIVKNDAQEFNIALVHLGNEEYKAFELQCTHQPNPLVATPAGFYCNAHGSAFNLRGEVSHAPADKPLRSYPIEILNESIHILL